eukprot:15455483-Alexandrium_andersonii.AAC.1
MPLVFLACSRIARLAEGMRNAASQRADVFGRLAAGIFWNFALVMTSSTRYAAPSFTCTLIIRCMSLAIWLSSEHE